jgi:ATP/maltotriose-dependent transcriptional regulator MalT
MGAPEGCTSMSNTPLTADLQTILNSIRALLARGELTLAAALLADHTTTFLEQGHRALIKPLLDTFPQDFTDESTDLRYVKGLVLGHDGQFDEARNLLERARFSFLVTQAYAKAVSAALAIVQLLFRQDNIVTAQHYLQELIRPLIETEKVTDQRLHGRLY